mmetsp:Transcript_7529/g.20402  ORF Transcript_7529/g.20402 Transcript_7529/m.20402 type:complete len:275 (-) Transcript_7529:262-1086(-)
MHDRAVPEALDVLIQALVGVVPDDAAALPARHPPALEALERAPHALTGAGVHQVHERVAQPGSGAEVHRQVHEIVEPGKAHPVEERQEVLARVVVGQVADHHRRALLRRARPPRPLCGRRGCALGRRWGGGRWTRSRCAGHRSNSGNGAALPSHRRDDEGEKLRPRRHPPCWALGPGKARGAAVRQRQEGRRRTHRDGGCSKVARAAGTHRAQVAPGELVIARRRCALALRGLCICGAVGLVAGAARRGDAFIVGRIRIRWPPLGDGLGPLLTG